MQVANTMITRDATPTQVLHRFVKRKKISISIVRTYTLVKMTRNTYILLERESEWNHQSYSEVVTNSIRASESHNTRNPDKQENNAKAPETIRSKQKDTTAQHMRKERKDNTSENLGNIVKNGTLRPIPINE